MQNDTEPFHLDTCRKVIGKTARVLQTAAGIS